MRIIAGLAKGMRLTVPRSGVRPTADRIREAIFSSLGGCVIDARVLDLYAGTGALGLEAASRGAASVVFVENTSVALESLERNVKNFQQSPTGKCAFSVVRAGVMPQLQKMARAGEAFSLIFADPPYGETAQKLLVDEPLPELLSVDGKLVLESAKRVPLTIGNPWELKRESIYGDTRVSFLRKTQ
ncbi:MAG TPA: RsmD family RNA methyltransferase [Verrucomicrobiae bacterium]|nr:RsmD family RNA methyltransferase [Verrucomicrobiae bacterium]